MKKDQITFQDFLKLDIRIGEVKNAEAVPDSKKLLKLAVDLGEDYGTVVIFTGMAQFYTPDNFTGRKFAFIANLEPKKMLGEFSRGMILSADMNDKPVLIGVQSEVPNGSVIR